MKVSKIEKLRKDSIITVTNPNTKEIIVQCSFEEFMSNVMDVIMHGLYMEYLQRLVVKGATKSDD